MSECENIIALNKLVELSITRSLYHLSSSSSCEEEELSCDSPVTLALEVESHKDNVFKTIKTTKWLPSQKQTKTHTRIGSTFDLILIFIYRM